MKQEFPPLLGPGFHPRTLKELRELCVSRFPFSTTRSVIMNNLETVVNNLKKSNIDGEVWINGSFVTEKIDPEDSDILCHFSGESYDSSTPQQREAIDIVETNLKHQFMCDSYVLPYYPKGHQWYNDMERNKDYWIRQFGVSREGQPKGIAVITL